MCKFCTEINKLLILHLTLNNVLIMLLAISIIATGTALFVQHVLGFIPCAMCFYERMPYYCIIFVSLFGIFFKKFAKLSITIIMLAIVASIGLSAYHTSLEHGLLQPTEMCQGSLTLPTNASVDDIKNILYSNTKANCAQPPFKIFGLSFTEWNFLMNVVLLIGVGYTLSVNRQSYYKF